MKKFLLLFALIFVAFSLKAQEQIFFKGDKVVNLGVGMGSYLTSISVSGELGVMDGVLDLGSFGLGGIVGLGTTLSNNWVQRNTFVIAARGTFHYPFIENLDTYTGLTLGFRHNAWKYSNNDVDLIGSFFLGARYYFADQLSFFGEIGAGIEFLTVGVSYKF